MSKDFNPRARVVVQSNRYANAVIVSHLDNFDDVLSLIPKRSRGQRRLLEFLNENPQTLSGKSLNGRIEISNISHEVGNEKYGLNQRIKNTGYQVKCERPLIKLFNSFGDKSDRHLWSIYFENPEAANDPVFLVDESQER